MHPLITSTSVITVTYSFELQLATWQMGGRWVKVLTERRQTQVSQIDSEVDTVKLKM